MFSPGRLRDQTFFFKKNIQFINQAQRLSENLADTTTDMIIDHTASPRVPQREVIGRRLERKDVLEEAKTGSRLLENHKSSCV